MKIHSFLLHILLFTAIFFVFILPPLCNDSAATLDFSDIRLILLSSARCMCAVFLYFFIKHGDRKNSSMTSVPPTAGKIRFAVTSGYILVTFGALCVTASLLQITAFFTGKTDAGTKIIPPSGISGWTLCILEFLFAAIFEECMYRSFFPDFLYKLLGEVFDFSSERVKKICYLFCECSAMLVFAFSHRYLGFFAVVNGAAGYVILRICYRKTGRIFSNTSAHFFYNILSLILFI